MTAITSILSELESAFENDEYADARSLVEELFDAYDEHALDERRAVERAKAINRRDSDAAPEPVADYLSQVEAANLNRAGASLGLGVGIANPDEVDRDLGTFVAELGEREEHVADAAEAAAPELESVDLPASPRLLSTDAPDEPVAVGSTFGFSATVGNVGDEPTDELTVSVAGGDGLAVTDDTRTVQLDAAANATFGFEIRATAPGTHRATAELSSDGSTASAEVEALDTVGFLDRADDRLGRLADRIRSADAPNRGRSKRLLSKIDASKEHLDRALAAAESGDGDHADRQATTAINQLGAFINAVEAKDSGGAGDSNGGNDGRGNGGGNTNTSGFSTRQRVGFVTIAEEAIDLLATAREANL